MLAGCVARGLPHSGGTARYSEDLGQIFVRLSSTRGRWSVVPQPLQLSGLPATAVEK
eukprot:SAG11_NODE_36179_length_263_cov_0.615854_1_plen_56_part_10